MTYTRFTEVGDTGKTKVWSVDNINDGSHIGMVKWHGAWRKYVLLPEARTIWSADCLRDVAAFIEQQMTARRRKPSSPESDAPRCVHGCTGPHQYEVSGASTYWCEGPEPRVLVT